MELITTHTTNERSGVIMEYFILRLDTNKFFCGFDIDQLTTYDMYETTKWSTLITQATRSYSTVKEANNTLNQLLRFGIPNEQLQVIQEQSLT